MNNSTTTTAEKIANILSSITQTTDIDFLIEAETELHTLKTAKKEWHLNLQLDDYDEYIVNWGDLGIDARYLLDNVEAISSLTNDEEEVEEAIELYIENVCCERQFKLRDKLLESRAEREEALKELEQI